MRNYDSQPGHTARAAPDGTEPPKPWRERLQDIRTAYGNVPAAFRLVWGADKRSTIVMALLTLIGAALPISQAWVGKLIVDSVVHSIAAGVGSQAGLIVALPYLGIEFGLILLGAVISQIRRLTEHVLNARLGHYINSSVIRKALALDLHYFEDASFYDKLQNARREADFPRARDHQWRLPGGAESDHARLVRGGTAGLQLADRAAAVWCHHSIVHRAE